MTDFQARTTKTTTQTENRLRNVEYSENTVRSDIQALYDQILEKRAAYDAAKTAYESGKMVRDAAQIQKQNGSLSQIQYLQQELAWLTTESGYHCADKGRDKTGGKVLQSEDCENGFEGYNF